MGAFVNSKMSLLQRCSAIPRSAAAPGNFPLHPPARTCSSFSPPCRPSIRPPSSRCRSARVKRVLEREEGLIICWRTNKFRTSSECAASEAFSVAENVSASEERQNALLCGLGAPECVLCERVAPERAVCERVEPKRAVCKRVAPERAICERLAPERAICERLAPKRVAGERVAPERAICLARAKHKWQVAFRSANSSPVAPSFVFSCFALLARLTCIKFATLVFCSPLHL